VFITEADLRSKARAAGGGVLVSRAHRLAGAGDAAFADYRLQNQAGLLRASVAFVAVASKPPPARGPLPAAPSTKCARAHAAHATTPARAQRLARKAGALVIFLVDASGRSARVGARLRTRCCGGCRWSGRAAPTGPRLEWLRL
jgi:Mg-chelatase subunit ChlD